MKQIYNDLLKERETNNYRFGLHVPVTEDLESCFASSLTDTQVTILTAFKNFYDQQQTTGDYITTNALKKLTDRIPTYSTRSKITIIKVKEVLIASNLISSKSKLKKIKGDVIRVYMLNLTEIKKLQDQDL